MSIGRLMNQPLSIQKTGSTVTDEYGDETVVPVGSAVTVFGYLEQSETEEFTEDRDTTVSKWKAFLPVGTDVGHLDFITFQSSRFQVDGEPWHVYNPRLKTVDHIETRLIVDNG